MSGKEKVTVSVGETSVAIQRAGRSSPTVAEILGRPARTDGRTHLVLDRLVHGPSECVFEGWSVSGAVVTELVSDLPMEEKTNL